MGSARIALANLRPGDTPEEAASLARQAVADAGRERVDVICFPECYVPGYRTAARVLPPPNAQALSAAWTDIASAAREANVAVVLGTERIVDGEPRITALVVNRDGSVAGFQDKVQLDPSEERMYSRGAERQLFRVGDLTFGVAICHEGWRYPETVRWAARRGAQLVFHPHFHEPETGGYRPTAFADPLNTFHEKAMLCRAAENTIWFASVNCAIAGSPTTSAIVRPDGTALAWQPYGQHGLLVADIDLSTATRFLASRCR